MLHNGPADSGTTLILAHGAGAGMDSPAMEAFAVGLALEKNPAVAKAMTEAGWEIATHGYRWIDYQYVKRKKTKKEAIKLQNKSLKILFS